MKAELSAKTSLGRGGRFAELLRAGSIGLICVLSVACAPDPGREGVRIVRPPVGAIGDVKLYLPRVSTGPVKLYFPTVMNANPRKTYFPVVRKLSPACAGYGADCLEPNDTFAIAPSLTEFGRPYFGTVLTPTVDPRDLLKMSFVAGQAYSITLGGGQNAGQPFTGLNDVDLYVFSPVFQLLALSDAYGQVPEAILFVPPVTGLYVIGVYPYETPGGPAPYRLEIRKVP